MEKSPKALHYLPSKSSEELTADIPTKPAAAPAFFALSLKNENTLKHKNGMIFSLSWLIDNLSFYPGQDGISKSNLTLLSL
jgi:hypothetical protein